jgi:hypothetical protein
MVISRMSSKFGSDTERDVIVTHPNRGKAVVKTTRATVIFLLLVSAALVLIITIGGWHVLEGVGPVAVQLVFVALDLLLAFYAARWSRGSLPVASALAVLLATFALVAAPSWFDRDKAGFAQPGINAGLLGVLTLLVIPVQILLIAFAMRGFSQGWNVELEQRDPYADAGDYRDPTPHPA